MRKLLLIFLVVILSFYLVAMLSLTGCKEKVAEEAEEEVAEEVEEEVEPAEKEEEKEPVTISILSWNINWEDSFNTIFDEFEKLCPNITVETKFITIDYDTHVNAGLELGEAEDVYQLRSFDISRMLYNAGYLMELNEELIPNLSKFDDSYVSGWRTEDGIIYGVPYMASSHGIFYNTDIFNEYNLNEPETWEELMNICEILQSNGVTPFIDGGLFTVAFWSTWYPGLGANFYGGEDSRQKLMAGDMKFTDEPFVKAFEAMVDLSKYHREDFMSLDYVEGINLFLNGEGAMLIDGGWIEDFLVDAEFEIGWFGPPVEDKGDTPWFCFHLDNGLGINKDTEHPDEALLLVNWMTTEDFGNLFLNNIKGEFVTTPGDYEGGTPLMKEVLEFAANSNLTIRIMQEKLSSQDPSGQILMEEAFNSLFSGELTPKGAAEHIQEGLASWYEPLMD